MSDSTHREPIEILAEEFLERRRRGERVTVEQYAGAHPALAEEILDLFPTMAALEEAKPATAAQQPSPFAAPDRLGDLRLLRELGRGGMGVVYEAQQESLSRRVAVKVLPARVLFDTKQLERFRREARTAGSLQHPGIVPIFSVGEQEGLHYLVMQLIDGVGLDVITRHVGARTKSQVPWHASSVAMAGDVTCAIGFEQGLALAVERDDFQLAEQSGPLAGSSSEEAPTIALSQVNALGSSARASSMARSLLQSEEVNVDAIDPQYYRSIAKIGIQTAEALAYAHQRGVLHRDIKPANLLLDRTGRVWVTDFGLAKAVQQADLSRTGELLGTLRYMPPEQLQGQASTLSDLYALGLTLYELVTFRSPFDADTPSEVLQKINQQAPAKPRQINPHVPVDLEHIILRAMAAEPASRYPDGQALADDLRRFLNQQPVTVPAVAITTRLREWTRRHQRVVIGATAFLLGGLVLAALGSWWNQPTDTWPPTGPAVVQPDRPQDDTSLPPEGQARSGRPPLDPLGLGPPPAGPRGAGRYREVDRPLPPRDRGGPPGGPGPRLGPGPMGPRGPAAPIRRQLRRQQILDRAIQELEREAERE